ncbi:MAG: glycosyltransferase family 39 protein [Terriglobia bacterium]|jgi:hypothetical protein
MNLVAKNPVAAVDAPLVREDDNSAKGRSNSRFLIVGSVVLFCFCLATRVPLRSRLLSGWDPVQFAQAIHHFDISHDRPQPPGYIVYVGLARLLFGLLHDDNLTLTTLSALFSSLSTVLIFLLAFSMYDRRTALLASAVWATCPLVWFHGLIGEIYASAGFSSLAVGLAVFVLLRSPSALTAACAGIVYGLATGLRPDQVLLLAPLFLFPFWRSQACRRGAPLAFISAMVVYGAWYIPTVISAGGYGSYSRLVSTQLSTAVRRENIFFGASLVAHMWMLIRLASGLALGLLPLLLVLAILWTLRRSNLKADRIKGDDALFLAVWAVPFLLFYSLIFIGRVSYSLACLPPLLLLVSRWAVINFAGQRRDGKARFWLLPFLAVVANGGVFFLIPRVPETKVTSQSFSLSRIIPDALNRSMLSCVYDQLRFDQAVKKRYFEEIWKLRLEGDSAVLFIQLGPPDCLNERIFEYYFPNVPFYTALGASEPIPGFRRPLPVRQAGSPNEARPLQESEGGERGPTLEVARDRVLMLYSKGLLLDVDAKGGSAQPVKTEDRDDRSDIYQVYDLRLTPTSWVDVRTGRQSVSIVERP